MRRLWWFLLLLPNWLGLLLRALLLQLMIMMMWRLLWRRADRPWDQNTSGRLNFHLLPASSSKAH